MSQNETPPQDDRRGCFIEEGSLISESMQKGHNSDIQVRGRTYHVQTEDWGTQNPFLVTRVFSGGAVLKTIKISYTEALRGGPVNDVDAVKLALRQQHHRILDQLVSGQLEPRP